MTNDERAREVRIAKAHISALEAAGLAETDELGSLRYWRDRLNALEN